MFMQLPDFNVLHLARFIWFIKDGDFAAALGYYVHIVGLSIALAHYLSVWNFEIHFSILTKFFNDLRVIFFNRDQVNLRLACILERSINLHDLKPILV